MGEGPEEAGAAGDRILSGVGAGEVVGREPGSVATRLGEQEKTTARGLDR